MKQKKHKYTQTQINLCTVKWAQCDKPNHENCKNCSSKCAYDCAQLQYTIQHRTVLIPSYLQTNIIAQMLSIGVEGVKTVNNRCNR